MIGPLTQSMEKLLSTKLMPVPNKWGTAAIREGQLRAELLHKLGLSRKNLKGEIETEMYVQKWLMRNNRVVITRLRNSSWREADSV